MSALSDQMEYKIELYRGIEFYCKLIIIEGKGYLKYYDVNKGDEECGIYVGWGTALYAKWLIKYYLQAASFICTQQEAQLHSY